MFDWVACDYEIEKDDIVNSYKFQTKNLDKLLDTYIITDGGALERDGFQEIYEGILHFYAVIDGWWHEYETYFVGGYLMSLKKIHEYNLGDKNAQ